MTQNNTIIDTQHYECIYFYQNIHNCTSHIELDNFYKYGDHTLLQPVLMYILFDWFLSLSIQHKA